jgi:GT2 family glycosyltransferase
MDFFNKNIKNGVLVFSKTNLGVINGRNLLYKISSIINGRGENFEYLMFLDNDQMVFGDWLDHHASVLNSSKADVAGVEAWLMSPGFMPIENVKTINKSFSYVGCGGMLVKREVVENIGMFDERFNPAYFEDPDFIFRCIEKGYKVAWNIKAKIIHKPHQTLGNIKNNDRIKILQESHKKFCEKWKGKKPPVIKQIKIKEFD